MSGINCSDLVDYFRHCTRLLKSRLQQKRLNMIFILSLERNYAANSLFCYMKPEKRYLPYHASECYTSKLLTL